MPGPDDRDYPTTDPRGGITPEEASNIGTVIDFAIAVASCIFLTNTNASRARAQIDTFVSAGMALAIYLASRQLSTGATSNLLSFASIVALAVASVVGSTSSNIIAMTHAAQCVKAALFTPESSSLFETMLSILIHAAVAHRLSTPLVKQTIVGYIYGILHVDTFRIIKGFENGIEGQGSSTYVSDLEMLKDQGPNFYIDTTQRLFLVRAILRAFKREFVLILTGIATCKFILHYRRLLFARILETFVADYSGSSAQAFKLVGLWSALALAKMDVYAMKLRNATNSALPPKFQQGYINICQHMKTIKLYAWEPVFLHDIGLGKVKYVTPPLVWLAQFTMKALNSSLSEIAASLAIISQLRPNSSFSYVEMTIILSSMSSLVAFTRSLGSISEKLNYIGEMETVFKQIVSAHQANYIVRKTAAKDTAAKMNDSEFSWGKDKFSIRSSALEIKQGEFVAIVGKVGCGKSSIVSALCGEMPLEKGEACIFGSIGYVSQKPWIMNATFRDNILLGNEYDEKRYNQTIEACALTEDLKLMPAGDMSEIGHAGINLSGGQKTRLALARAIYMDADVYIFDDLLSAVDAHVERHLVERVLVGNGLLADKTRILVTHAEHVVPLCDKVITIDHGDILVTPQEKMSYSVMAVHDPTPSADLAEACAKHTTPSTSNAKSGEFTVTPELEVPAFSRQTLWKFIALSGYTNVATAIAFQFLFSYGFYYVEGLRMEMVKGAGTELMASALKRYLIVNAVATIMKCQIGSISTLISSHMWFDRVEIKMTNSIVEALLFAPLPVFERMSKGTLEKLMHDDVMLASHHLPSHLCSRVYEIRKKVQGIIVKAARGSNARLRENILQEVLAGKEVMRTHDRVDHYIEKLAEASAKAAMLENHSMRIALIKARVEEIVVDALYICILVYCKLASLNDPSSFGPGNVDMMMRFSGSTLKKLSSISFSDIGVTQCLPSLSRFFVYAEQLGREAPHVIKDTQPSADWPVQGAIEFKDYSMSYRSELGPVLNQLSFKINGKEKVGIVGRTGAGKSSLTYALLRLVEPAAGSVFIDGVDTSTIGLHTLRSNISVVPQDPVLFEGTIRDNLDPKHEYTDAQIWEAIEKAKVGHLLTTPAGTFDSTAKPNGHSIVRNPSGNWIAGVGLDKWVSTNGANFSVGERQLLSLCRALLWQRAILIMDEATANIDSATDQVMQAVIREEFSDKTVLTIAHRLNTVMNCDRILVLDAGKIQEFDSPSELLSRDGHFSRLVESMKFNEKTKE
ncbi:Canalicular multispecific organic anion transporter 1 [Coemansia sp. S146]|nr:Canalicular multispecific organic anion transporter 1 [Coemansia sp. S146]